MRPAVAILALVAAFLLSACGFQLRGSYSLPYESLFVDMPDASVVGAGLKRQIRAGTGTRLVDSKEDAHRLVKLLEGIPAKVNLIPFNEWPGAPYKRSSGNRIHAFADIIHNAGYASPIRTPRGEDIMAACGQLKSATERGRKSRAEIAAEVG